MRSLAAFVMCCACDLLGVVLAEVRMLSNRLWSTIGVLLPNTCCCLQTCVVFT